MEEDRLESLQEKLWPKEQMMEPQRVWAGRDVRDHLLPLLPWCTSLDSPWKHLACGIRVGMLVIKAGALRDAAKGFKWSLGVIGIKGIKSMLNAVKKGRKPHVEFGFSVIKENKQ